MGDKQNYEFWGLSLSLKPPITHVDDDQKLSICKRDAQLFTDEQRRKIRKSNNKALMIMPRINNNTRMDVKPQLVIDLEVEKTGKVLGSPNSTLSSSANNSKMMGGYSGDQREMISNDDGGEGGDGVGHGGGCGGERGESKKLRLTKEQIMVLEQAFKEHTTLNTKRKVALAKRVNLRPRQVEVWFQNRRARTKLKQTEVDCDYLRRFCKSLTEENKKLQKEVQELKAIKVSPDTQANHPPTTLTMCPSCKTVSFSSPSTTTQTPASETGRCLKGTFNPPIPFNLKKLSLTVNNNRMLETNIPHS